MAIITVSGGGGSGTVTSVTAADTSIVVAGTAAAPTIATGTLDAVAASHPPAANWSNNAKKITGLANGTASTDAAAFGQIPVASNGYGITGNTGATPAPAVALTTASNYLSGDVSMPTGNTYVDGPTLTLAAGTWLLTGQVMVTRAGGGTNVTAKLWDGTTVISSAQGSTNINPGGPLAVSGIVSPVGSTTYKISAAADAATVVMKAAAPLNSAGNTASFLNAVRIA